MDLVIRNDNGDVLSKVPDVTMFTACSTVTTEHGVFQVDEVGIDYVKNEINIYSTGYSIMHKWEGKYNKYGTFLASRD